MAFDFDRVINRKNTHSYKWDQSEKLFGRDDVLPMWVADMDFESPPAVKDALTKRAAQGVYGYTFRPERYEQAIVDWFERRHDWTIEPSWLTHTPGVVPALSMAIDLFSKPGGTVVLQPPVYHPFYDVIRKNGREVASNPLVIRNGRYEMDEAHLETLFAAGADMLLLCSPHNPTSRIWERDVLERLARLCQKYDVTVISDEIHCDIELNGHKHIPFAAISDDAAQRTITCLAPTKTFNMPGLQLSFTAIANDQMRRAFENRLTTLSLHMANYFHVDALIAAYDESEQWLDDMLVYLEANVDFAMDYFHEHLPAVTPFRPEGTILLWVDCRPLGLDVNALKQLMYDARVAFVEGSVFGEEGRGFVRINLACPREMLQEGLKRFCDAARKKLNATSP